MKINAVNLGTGAPAIDGLPVAAQALFDQLCAAPTAGARREIYDRMVDYLARFASHDIPQAATSRLNDTLKGYDLPPVSTPVSANQAAFAALTAKAARGIATTFSAHTGRDEPVSGERVAARRTFINDLQARVTSFGASLTNEELRDAARILEIGLPRA